MKKQFSSFPKIEQFRNVVYNVNRHSEFDGFDNNGEPIINVGKVKPTIKFIGTVKLHGTNAGVGWNGEEIWAQSRTSIITSEKDNAGFAFFVKTRYDIFRCLMDNVKTIHNIDDDENIIVYGEWCGKGIQKGVGISQLDKMFVIFGIKIANSNEETPNQWLDYDHEKLIFNNLAENRVFFIQGFPTYEITINFNEPEQSQNQLVELTSVVEAQCPVAKALNAEGIGEGIVWLGSNDGNNYRFKVKGGKHSVTKVKKLASVDPEKLASIKEFIEYAVTDNRLEQGINETFTSKDIEIDKKGLGNFLKWVTGDICREEKDTLVSNGLEPKDVIKSISSKSVKWFVTNYGL